MIGGHMGDRDARIAGFCAEFDGGCDGRGPGPPKPLKKLKIAVFGGPGSGPGFSIYCPYWPGVGCPYWPRCGLE